MTSAKRLWGTRKGTVASPIKPSDIQSTIPSSTGSICEKLQALWSLATKMSTWFSYFYNEDGTISDETKADLEEAGVGVPTGAIVFWPLSSIPTGWLSLNGQIVSREEYSGLYGVIGITYGAGDGATTFKLPDMSNRFPLGYGTRAIGTTGGAESVELEDGNIPELEVTALFTPANVLVGVGSGGSNSAAAGTGVDRFAFDELFDTIGEADPDPVDIMNPYFVGAWIIKT